MRKIILRLEFQNMTLNRRVNFAGTESNYKMTEVNPKIDLDQPDDPEALYFRRKLKTDGLP